MTYTKKPRPVHALMGASKKGYMPPTTLCYRDPFRKGVRVSYPSSINPEPVTCPECLNTLAAYKALKTGKKES